MEELIQHLKSVGVLRSPRLQAALQAVDRVDFVPSELRAVAYLDEPLSIGEGQTISQPYTVVFMLEALAVEVGNAVLEIGYGSTWQTALLAHLVGAGGLVYALEIRPALARFGEENLKTYPALYARTRLFCQSGAANLPVPAGGFDRIIAAAAVTEPPPAWADALKTGGRMVYPQDGALIVAEKTASGRFRRQTYPGFAFVPFVSGSDDF